MGPKPKDGGANAAAVAEGVDDTMAPEDMALLRLEVKRLEKEVLREDRLAA